MSHIYLHFGYMPEVLVIVEWVVTTGLGGPTSNAHDYRIGYMAQPAIRKIADWAGWPNQQY